MSEVLYSPPPSEGEDSDEEDVRRERHKAREMRALRTLEEQLSGCEDGVVSLMRRERRARREMTRLFRMGEDDGSGVFPLKCREDMLKSEIVYLNQQIEFWTDEHAAKRTRSDFLDVELESD